MISNVHRASPIQMRYTINYRGVERNRFFFAPDTFTPEQTAGAMAENLNLIIGLIDSGQLKPYNEAEHISEIMRDARRYGTD